MDGAGPMTSAELAAKTNISERYAREWLAQNAASGYLNYDAGGRRFELPPEQAMVFADEESPCYMGGGFDAVAALYQTQPLVEGAFKSGGGVEWDDQAGCLFCAMGAMLRPRYSANIVQNWLPALDGVVTKLERGAKVADVGCGLGHSTFIMAKRSRTQPSSVTISTSHRSSMPRSVRERVAVPAISDSRLPQRRTFLLGISIW
jgi:hypothetical protein